MVILMYCMCYIVRCMRPFHQLTHSIFSTKITSSHLTLLPCKLGWAKLSKMLPSFLPRKLRVFEGYSHQILEPKCCPHSHVDNWKFPEAALILKNSRNSRMSRRILKNYQVYLIDYCVQGHL